MQWIGSRVNFSIDKTINSKCILFIITRKKARSLQNELDNLRSNGRREKIGMMDIKSATVDDIFN